MSIAKRSRNSSVELYKVLAMLLICLSHSVQTMEKFTDFSCPVTDFGLLLMQIFRHFGQFGNMIFVICSSYFLLDSRRCKSEKAINILLNSCIISISMFAVFAVAGKVFDFNINYSFEFVVSQFIPDIFDMVWFIPTYVIFYLVHPYLNLVIENISEEKHKLICISIAFFYGIMSMFHAAPTYSSLLGFCCIYFIVGYFKKYRKDFMDNPKLNIILFCVFAIIFLAVIVIRNLLGNRFNILQKYPDMTHMLNIITFSMLFCLFNIFRSFNFKSAFINKLSSLSLFFYCIHENYIVRGDIRPQIYEFLISKFGDTHLLAYIVAMFISLLIFGFSAAFIYSKTIGKVTPAISIMIKNKCLKLVKKI